MTIIPEIVLGTSVNISEYSRCYIEFIINSFSVEVYSFYDVFIQSC